MSYSGTGISKNAIVAQSAATYTLSAGATEDAYVLSFQPLDITTGEGIRIKLRGTTAGNANNKTIKLECTGGTTISIQNNTTAAPNAKDFIVDVTMLIQSGSTVVYDARITFDGIADEIQTGTGTITLTSGTPRITAELTGAAASDIITYGMVIEKIKLDS